MLFIIVLEAKEKLVRMSRSIALFSKTLVNKTLAGMKGRLEASEEVSKGLTGNVKKTKMLISSENARKVTYGDKFLGAVYRKAVRSKYILCQFCTHWLHNKCSSTNGKLEEDNKFKCQILATQRTDIAEDGPGIKNSMFRSTEILEKFCYLGGATGAGGSRWQCYNMDLEWVSKFRESVPLLTNRGLALQAKVKPYSACVCRVILCASETWLVKGKDMIKLEGNKTRIVRWMWNLGVRFLRLASLFYSVFISRTYYKVRLL